MKRIMVVDDLPDQIFTIKQTLENLDDEYEIIGVESGEQCLELLMNKGEVPDLILSETRMPGMTGRELLDRLKENPTWKDIPIFFLTAWEDKFVKNGIGDLGDGHIEKPFDMRDLKEKIDTFLKKQ